MNSKFKITLLVIIAFTLGFQLNGMISENNSDESRVTSIGGIFFKSKNPKELRNWYMENLGIKVNDYGAVFEWRHGLDYSQKGFTQWSPFNEKTNYFEPSAKDFMINYRVANLDNLINNLRQKNVTVLDSIESYDYGRFVHIMDLEGNKIELWEPNDIAYEKLGESINCETNK